jgi:hypothetical protein
LTSIDSIAKHPLLSDKFNLYAGLYLSYKEMKIVVDGANKNKITFFVNFNWRFSQI